MPNQPLRVSVWALFCAASIVLANRPIRIR